jgi:2-hydroxy-6-oxonona-2,4-dienedioate hydrolase
MEPIQLQVEGRPARVLVGGQGVPILLVHGGWGGPTVHWGPVLEPLSRRYRVVVPELPGLGDLGQPGLASITEYGRWLVALLDALEIPSAWWVGSSFGVSVAVRAVSDAPARCRGLVFVNGFALRATPPLLLRLGERRAAKRLLQAIEQWVLYRPAALERGFFDPANVPPDLRAFVTQRSAPHLSTLVDVLVRGGGPPAPLPVAPLLLWGQEDHLPGSSEKAARKLAASLPGSELVFIPRAGHLPQVERPEAFVEALTAFVAKREASAMRIRESGPTADISA